jgi:hypothetical protein
LQKELKVAMEVTDCNGNAMIANDIIGSYREAMVAMEITGF